MGLLHSIQIQTTPSCNAVCAMCPYPTSWMKTKEGRGRMSDELYEKIVLNLKEENFSGEFIPYLGNETFMDPDMLDRIELAIKLIPKFRLVIDSNMSRLSEEKIDRLYDLWKSIGFRGKFTISHHGIDKKTMESIMGIPYEKCVENIVYLIKKFNGSPLPIIIHACCDFKESDVDLDGVFRDTEAGKKKYTADALDRVTWESVSKYWKKLVPEYGIDESKFIISNRRHFSDPGVVSLARLVPNSKANRAPIRKTLKNWKRTNCARINGWMHVHWNGQVTLCCRTVYDNKDDVILGNMMDSTIKEVLSSKQCGDVFNMVRGKKESRYDFPCKSC
mgnify:CR=1 FL=1